METHPQNDSSPTKVSATNGTFESLIPGEDDFATLFEESHQSQAFREGEIVQGRVVALTKDTVVVDVGAKSEGEVDLAQFKDPDTGEQIELAVGDIIDVFVEVAENDFGVIQLSKEKADRLKIWDEISKACELDELVEGVIVGRVKGGLSVDIGVKAFLPGSQIDIRPVRNLESYVGEKFAFKVIKFNRKRGNIVLSRRALLEKERESMKKHTLDHLEEGAELVGTVKNITEYGAFVDLGGIDGLLHITDMSWGRVNHPSELYKVGDEIKVMILKFNPDTERVSLGVKQLSEDPWEHADRRYPVGSRVFGKVVSLTDYGAFVELEEGIDGLVHISEISWTKRVKHPSKVLAIGDEVECVVLDVNIKDKRISLGMKQIEPNPWSLLHDRYPIGSTIRGTVRNITEFGVFVGIEDGIDGLVHISDLSWTYRVKHPSELHKKGDDVEAVVLSIDPDAERFSLGIKQLFPDPWGHIPRAYSEGRTVSGLCKMFNEVGLFVELEPGVDALIPREDLPAEFQVKEDDDVTGIVTIMDPHERRLELALEGMVPVDADGAPRKSARQVVADADGEARTTMGDLFKDKLAGLSVPADEDGEAAEASDEEAAPEEAAAAEETEEAADEATDEAPEEEAEEAAEEEAVEAADEATDEAPEEEAEEAAEEEAEEAAAEEAPEEAEEAADDSDESKDKE